MKTFSRLARTIGGCLLISAVTTSAGCKDNSASKVLDANAVPAACVDKQKKVDDLTKELAGINGPSTQSTGGDVVAKQDAKTCAESGGTWRPDAPAKNGCECPDVSNPGKTFIWYGNFQIRNFCKTGSPAQLEGNCEKSGGMWDGSRQAMRCSCPHDEPSTPTSEVCGQSGSGTASSESTGSGSALQPSAQCAAAGGHVDPSDKITCVCDDAGNTPVFKIGNNRTCADYANGVTTCTNVGGTFNTVSNVCDCPAKTSPATVKLDEAETTFCNGGASLVDAVKLNSKSLPNSSAGLSLADDAMKPSAYSAGQRDAVTVQHELDLAKDALKQCIAAQSSNDGPASQTEQDAFKGACGASNGSFAADSSYSGNFVCTCNSSGSRSSIAAWRAGGSKAGDLFQSCPKLDSSSPSTDAIASFKSQCAAAKCQVVAASNAQGGWNCVTSSGSSQAIGNWMSNGGMGNPDYFTDYCKASAGQGGTTGTASTQSIDGNNPTSGQVSAFQTQCQTVGSVAADKNASGGYNCVCGNRGGSNSIGNWLSSGGMTNPDAMKGFCGPAPQQPVSPAQPQPQAAAAAHKAGQFCVNVIHQNVCGVIKCTGQGAGTAGCSYSQWSAAASTADCVNRCKQWYPSMPTW